MEINDLESSPGAADPGHPFTQREAGVPAGHQPEASQSLAATPEFRVFRHVQTGMCVVLRNVESSRGFECVLGPAAAGGTSLTFSAALQFVRDALRQAALKLANGTYANETSLQDLEELWVKINAPGFFSQPAKAIA